jgi:hypothetical protein
MQLQFTGMCISTFSFWMELWWVGFFYLNLFILNNILVTTYFLKLTLLTTPCNLMQQNHYAKPVQSQRAQSPANRANAVSQSYSMPNRERQLRIERTVMARLSRHPPTTFALWPVDQVAGHRGPTSCFF